MTLEELLVQVRRIEKNREAGAEEKIRKAYQSLLKKLEHFLADEYAKLAEEDRLTYEILQKNSRYANFLEMVEKHINTMTPLVADTIQKTVKQTYKAVYDGMVDAVKKAGNLHENLKGLKACTPEVLKRAVENPVFGLTLKDTLEKHRKDVIYDIKQQIGVGLSNGDRFSTMAKRIQKTLEGDYEKAIRIVRTETHRVREAGNQDAAEEVNQALKKATSSNIMIKTWKTMKDERVRPSGKVKRRKYNHRKMDGVTIPVEKEFTLPSGAKTKAPGLSGIAGEDINCRCYLSYSLQKVLESKKR